MLVDRPDRSLALNCYWTSRLRRNSRSVKADESAAFGQRHFSCLGGSRAALIRLFPPHGSLDSEVSSGLHAADFGTLEHQ